MTKVLIVTGGASGIGAATARLGAARGYAVAINYRTREDEAGRLVEELQTTGARAVAIQADCRRAIEIAHLFATVDHELGPVTALVNSAGISLPPTRVADADPLEIENLLTTNVLGLMLCCREAVRRMSRRGAGFGGVIINVSSMAATIGGRPGSSHYAASKAAVDSFTLGLAKEVADQGIRAIAVRPGYTETGMTRRSTRDPSLAAAIAGSIPIGRPARVEEVAKPIVWLLSEEASFITGACIDISGGGFTIVNGLPPSSDRA
jgi:NAD(P)-dependent dehydrogenase (short-subunit alcohol dehydrogenase family)